MAENEFTFKQYDKFGLGVRVKLVDGRQLQVLNKSSRIEQAYSIDILSLKDKSKKAFSIAWKWLLACIGFFLLMLVLLKFSPEFFNSNKNLYLSAILVVGMLSGFMCFFQFWKRSSVKQIFYSRNAHVPLITLSIGKPSRKSFHSFIDTVEERIKKFRDHMDIAEDKQLTGEIKMLRRLSEKGIISKKVYERAKARLFKGFKT